MLDGKMVCHRAGELPFTALANDTYANSVAFVRKLKIHYCTHSQRQRRTLDFASLKLASRRSVQFVDMQMHGMDTGHVNWQNLTEARQRACLEAFLRQEALERGFADLTPIMEPLLQTLRGYRSK